MKTGYGNPQSLCVNYCNGTTDVPNDGHFACGKLTKYLINYETIKDQLSSCGEVCFKL